MRDILIGDVHGCTEELRELLGKLAPTKDDLVIFLGDLVDKGPDSAGTVRLARELSEQVPVVLILGNHELKHARYRKQVAEGKVPKMRNAEEIGRITAQLSDEDIAFLNQAKYWFRGRFGELAVHGGVPPSIKYLPDDHDLFEATKNPRAIDHYNQLTMTRYCNPAGYMVQLGRETAEDKFWADVYDGRFGHIYFGHQPYVGDSVKIHEWAIGLDTGCVFGGTLTAAVLENHGVYFIQVPARAKYAVAYGEEG